MNLKKDDTYNTSSTKQAFNLRINYCKQLQTINRPPFKVLSWSFCIQMIDRSKPCRTIQYNITYCNFQALPCNWPIIWTVGMILDRNENLDVCFESNTQEGL